MAVLVADPCRLLVQGLGRDGSFQAQRIVEYGTNMVAAVHPNRSGMKFMDEVPYFETAKGSGCGDRRQYRAGICSRAICDGCDP